MSRRSGSKVKHPFAFGFTSPILRGKICKVLASDFFLVDTDVFLLNFGDLVQPIETYIDSGVGFRKKYSLFNNKIVIEGHRYGIGDFSQTIELDTISTNHKVQRSRIPIGINDLAILISSLTIGIFSAVLVYQTSIWSLSGFAFLASALSFLAITRHMTKHQSIYSFKDSNNEVILEISDSGTPTRNVQHFVRKIEEAISRI